jgi:hypothetical protein
MKLHLYFVSFCFIIAQGLSAQTQNLSWSKSLGGSDMECIGFGYDATVQSAISNNGDIYIATSSYSTDGHVGENYGDRDVWLMKLSATGDSIWSKVIGGSELDIPTCILTTPDGGCIIGGYTYSNDGLMTGHHGDSDTDAFLTKLDANGNIIWLEQYGGSSFMEGVPAHDYIYDIKMMDNGNIIAVGQTNSQNGDLLSEINMDLFNVGMLLEVDPNGDIVNIKKIYRPDHDHNNPNILFRIEQKPDESGFFLMGESQHPLQSADKYWLLDINNEWEIVWQETYGSNVQNISRDMVLSSNGGMLITGTIQSADGDVTGEFMGDLADVWLFEVDASGNIINQKIIGGTQGETIYNIIPDGNDGYYLGGFIFGTDYYGSGSDETGADFWILHMDQQLDTLWTWKNGGTNSDILTSMHYNNGEIIVAGRTESTDSIITNPIGSRDVWLGKFDIQTQIAENSPNKGRSPYFYPNPASLWLNICGANFIRVLDLNGKVVLNKQIGSAKIELSLAGQLTPGIYVVEMHKDNKIYREKLIISAQNR